MLAVKKSYLSARVRWRVLSNYLGMTRTVLLQCPISTGNSMICSDIWVNTTSDISIFLYVISRAFRRVKFETILKYQSGIYAKYHVKNNAIICLYCYPQKVCNFTCRYFKLS